MKALYIWVVAAGSMLSGCATTSLFTPYPDQIAKVQASVLAGAGDAELASLQGKTQGAEGLLYSLERGRLAQLLGQYEVSKGDLDQAITQFETSDLQATVRASSLVSGLASFATNDNAIPYTGLPFERVMAHGFQALNYLGLGKPDEAEVELRRAADQQRNLAEKYSDEIAKAKASAETKQVATDKIGGYFAGLDQVAGQVKSSFQNAYVLYMSGVVWEARGERNRAVVDFRQALEMYPDNELLKDALERVEGRDARRKSGAGTIVVLYEEGFAPRKDEIKVPVPLLNGQILSLAFPFYHASSVSPYAGVQITTGDMRVEPVVLTNIGGLAARALKEQIPMLLVRQTARALAKSELQKQAERQFGAFGQLGGALYSFVSESADRRSWLMLPAYAAGAQLNLPAGQQVLKIQGAGIAIDQLIEVRPSKTTILRVVNCGPRVFAQTYEL